jgi:AcrR family transcriptional regulator
MPRQRSAKEPINTPLQNRRKATQRERLLKGMVAAATRDGYAGANVSAVIGEAGVSRPTFYDYFEDRDDCFVATVIDVHEQLLGAVRDAIARELPQQALASTIKATLAFAGSQPAEARFLMKETLAGGPAALDARDEGIAQTAKLVEDAFTRVPSSIAVPDVPVTAVLGALHRLLASRLRRGERALAGLEHDLLAWIASYEQRAGQHRWRKLRPFGAPGRSPYLPPTTLRAPPALGPGRPRLSEEEVAENHRQRIMFATSQIVQERGYTAATVSEITRVAGVDGRAFYRLFADKQEAFSAIHELGFQYLMAATAGAFFAGKSWPERIWEAFRATAQSIDDTPTFAHVAFVEAYAVGPRGIQRVEDSHIAFTIFLQEGYRVQSEGETPPSRLALEAIITTIFEIIYVQTRASAKPKTDALLAHFVHLCLAPFIGADATNQFVDEKLAKTRKLTRSTRVQPPRGRIGSRAGHDRRGTS